MASNDIGSRYQLFVLRALEASVYLRARDHGLTFSELRDIGTAVDAGGAGALREALDYLIRSNKIETVGPQYRLRSEAHTFATFVLGRFQPDFRNFDALDFCVKYLAHKWEHAGTRSADLAELVTKAAEHAIPEHDMRVAAVILVLNGFLEESGEETLILAPGRERWISPSEQADQAEDYFPERQRSDFVAVYELVRQTLANSDTGNSIAPADDEIPPLDFKPRGGSPKPAPVRTITADRGAQFIPKGKTFDAGIAIAEILSTAKKSIALVDNYVDHQTLAICSPITSNVTLRVVTTPKAMTAAFKVHAENFNKQHGGLSICTSHDFHDRFILIDEKDFYIIGPSLKDAGKRAAMFVRVQDVAEIAKFRTQFAAAWGAGAVVVTP